MNNTLRLGFPKIFQPLLFSNLTNYLSQNFLDFLLFEIIKYLRAYLFQTIQFFTLFIHDIHNFITDHLTYNLSKQPSR